ncbi:hypothetical protein BR93DRAFT_923395 [Coniochaeta sp. PMI_546]|nr:hypothetical protein BR93DRAFT_923395 [Coniochaeta sp. PMI_546]
MPGLTISTKDAIVRPPAAHSDARPSSPTGGPPISPITPTFAPAQPAPNATQRQPLPPFSQTRQTFTHSQPDQTGMPPPPAPPQPISFDDNPDVLALKSAISILQLQKARATRDVQSLNRAKEAALADTEGFIADLASGRVGTEADRLFPDLTPRRGAADSVDEEEDDDDSSDEEEEDEEMAEPGQKQDIPTDGASVSVPSSITPQNDVDKAAASQNRKEKRKKQPAAPPPAWRTLPKPQNVVRCPPINWSQYGVVGESLDKLHAEQQRAPTQGAPATLKPGPGGLTYEFKGESSSNSEQKRLVGIAAPYAPGKDKLDKKPKGGKR